MADKWPCVACRKDVTATKNGRYRSHSDGNGEPCEQSSTEIPEHVLAAGVSDLAQEVPRPGVDYAQCPQCRRNVKLTKLGYFENHNATLRGGDRCLVSGVRYAHARTTEDVELPAKPIDESVRPNVSGPAPSPVRRKPVAALAAPTTVASGDAGGTTKGESPTSDSEPPAPTPAEVNLARQPMSAPDAGSSAPAKVSNSPESPTTSSTSDGSSEKNEQPDTETSSNGSEGPFSLGVSYGRFLQPFSPFSQPGQIPAKIKLADSMSDRGKEIAARLRETFYAYTNRNAKDNRSAQKTLGPSEAGTPCDRQIAMKFLGIRPTNPQEGWAPFVGTAVHVELAKMFEWANGADSGRYVTEMPLSFGSAFVPRGTSDLLDRVLFMILDHKLMGSWSLNKLIQEGPSETYRIQGQIYALGAVLAGERVKEVAIVAWPRTESSLDKLYVHVEKFDRKIAEAALQRVERIARKVQGHQADVGQGLYTPIDAAKEFPAGDDCRWCPFHLKGDKRFERGCPGK